MTKTDLRKASVKKAKSFRTEHSEHSNFWMIMISISQALKASKAVIKTSLKFKNDTEKSDSASISFNLSSKTVIKHICQNCAFAKGSFAEWLKVFDCKLHRLMLWNSKKNIKKQRLQERLFERDISFMIEILKGNIENKVKLLVNLTKIEKHYSSAYVMY